MKVKLDAPPSWASFWVYKLSCSELTPSLGLKQKESKEERKRVRVKNGQFHLFDINLKHVP